MGLPPTPSHFFIRDLFILNYILSFCVQKHGFRGERVVDSDFIFPDPFPALNSTRMAMLGEVIKLSRKGSGNKTLRQYINICRNN
jgi:hypothetical protein